MSDKPRKGSLLGTLFKAVLGLVVLLAAVFFGGALMLPADYNYERSVVIAADRARIHKDVGDLRNWEHWGPWKAEDPQMTWTYSEKSGEVGSWTEWNSPKSGKGRIELTRVSEHSGIEYRMSFNGEDAGSGVIRYEAAPQDATRVTWVWKGSLGYEPMNRWFHKLGGSMINEMFDKGLGGIKNRAEAKK